MSEVELHELPCATTLSQAIALFFMDLAGLMSTLQNIYMWMLSLNISIRSSSGSPV